MPDQPHANTVPRRKNSLERKDNRGVLPEIAGLQINQDNGLQISEKAGALYNDESLSHQAMLEFQRDQHTTRHLLDSDGHRLEGGHPRPQVQHPSSSLPFAPFPSGNLTQQQYGSTQPYQYSNPFPRQDRMRQERSMERSISNGRRPSKGADDRSFSPLKIAAMTAGWKAQVQKSRSRQHDQMTYQFPANERHLQRSKSKVLDEEFLAQATKEVESILLASAPTDADKEEEFQAQLRQAQSDKRQAVLDRERHDANDLLGEVSLGRGDAKFHGSGDEGDEKPFNILQDDGNFPYDPESRASNPTQSIMSPSSLPTQGFPMTGSNNMPIVPTIQDCIMQYSDTSPNTSLLRKSIQMDREFLQEQNELSKKKQNAHKGIHGDRYLLSLDDILFFHQNGYLVLEDVIEESEMGLLEEKYQSLINQDIQVLGSDVVRNFGEDFGDHSSEVGNDVTKWDEWKMINVTLPTKHWWEGFAENVYHRRARSIARQLYNKEVYISHILPIIEEGQKRIIELPEGELDGIKKKMDGLLALTTESLRQKIEGFPSNASAATTASQSGSATENEDEKDENGEDIEDKRSKKSIIGSSLISGSINVNGEKVEICGENQDIIWEYDQLLSKKPNRPDAVFPIHQDMGYWYHPATSTSSKDPINDAKIPTWTATLSLAMDNCGEENGCLRVLPGSHRERKVLFKHGDVLEGSANSNAKSDGLLKPANDDELLKHLESQMIPVPCKRGSVTVHDEWIVHGSEGNHSSDWRHTYVTCFRHKDMIRYERQRGFKHSYKDKEALKKLRAEITERKI